VHGTGPLGGTGTEGCAATDGRGVSSGRIRSVVVPGADADGSAAAENGPGRAEPGGALDDGGSVGALDGRPVGVEVPGAGAAVARSGRGLPDVPGSASRAPSVTDLPPAVRAEPPVVGPPTGRGVVAALPLVEDRLAAGTGVPTGALAVTSTNPTSVTAEASATHRRRQ
jgi:hypothetical protein